MFWKRLLRAGQLVLACVLLAVPVLAADTVARERDEQTIRTTAKAYMAALAKGDAKAIAEFWTTDGDYIDDLGNAHPASELATEAELAAGQGPSPKMKVTASKIRFVTDDVAVEDGKSEIEAPDSKAAPSVRGHFHAVWVKQSARWRLASLCEIPAGSPSEQRLEELGWMVGEWIAANGDTQLEVKVQWNATGTFLLRDIKAIDGGKVVLRGSGRIGWDPLTRKLKSWGFDSHGGYDEATWTKDGNSWVGQGTGVLPDGRQSSSTTVITYDGQNSYVRQVLAGRVQGERIPDQEVQFTRKSIPQR